MFSQTRKKAFSRRSRTGCRTCRLLRTYIIPGILQASANMSCSTRRVKCDETPGECRNCKVAGWKCEGYDVVRLVLTAKDDPDPTTSLTLYQPTQNSHGLSREERRGFAFFQTATVPSMTSFFDSRLWKDLILPMSHSERAVTHAVVALAAVHEDLQSRGAPAVSC